MDAVAGPIGPQGSVERPVRCLFCGAISAWWVCGCEWARLVRDEELRRPRTVIRNGVPVIILCLCSGGIGQPTGRAAAVRYLPTGSQPILWTASVNI